MKYNIIKISENRELINEASNWFHSKWGVPKEAYIESMEASLEDNQAVPEWYLVMDGEEIIAGLGVIENDFHDRKDLTPNICAVYVLEEYRNQGIAGELLYFACENLSEKGIKNVYLITDHDSFYERYNWKFECMVQGDGETHKSRMYGHEIF